MILEQVLIYFFRMKFEEAVYEKLKEVPKGSVTTYKEIAIAVGKPGASRAVGNALNGNPNPIKTPCHRVVKSDLSIGGFAGGTKEKKRLLIKEGVKFDGDRVGPESVFKFCRS